MAEHEALSLTRELLEAIADRDWPAYERLTDPTLTCFEPETSGNLVPGLDFHRYYFELGREEGLRNETLVDPHVREIGGDAAVVSYVRLIQRTNGEGKPETLRYCETRVWLRTAEGWKHVHFHRSA